MIRFPHQGMIVNIDQLAYCTPDSIPNTTSNVPFIGDSTVKFDNDCAVMFKDSSLMGTFSLPLPVCYIATYPVYVISSTTTVSSVPSLMMPITGGTVPMQSVHSKSYHVDNNPWMLPDPLIPTVSVGYIGMNMPPSVVEIAYRAIQMASTDPDKKRHLPVEYDHFTSPSWATNHPSSNDFLDTVLPSDEAILEVMTD